MTGTPWTDCFVSQPGSRTWNSAFAAHRLHDRSWLSKTVESRSARDGRQSAHFVAPVLHQDHPGDGLGAPNVRLHHDKPLAVRGYIPAADQQRGTAGPHDRLSLALPPHLRHCRLHNSTGSMAMIRLRRAESAATCAFSSTDFPTQSRARRMVLDASFPGSR